MDIHEKFAESWKVDDKYDWLFSASEIIDIIESDSTETIQPSYDVVFENSEQEKSVREVREN